MLCRTGDIRHALFSTLLHFAWGFNRPAVESELRIAQTRLTGREVFHSLVKYIEDMQGGTVHGWAVSSRGTWTLTRASLSEPWIWEAIMFLALLAGIKHRHGARMGRAL